MNDMKVLPARLREKAEYVRRQLFADPGASLAELIRLADVPLRDGAAIADSIEPGAGAEYLK